MRSVLSFYICTGIVQERECSCARTGGRFAFRLTVEEKISLLRATSPGIPRLGIDKYYHGNEALHGVVRPGRFTVFPQAIGLAATWNPVLQQKVATVISDEARARWNELDREEIRKSNLAMY